MAGSSRILRIAVAGFFLGAVASASVAQSAPVAFEPAAATAFDPPDTFYGALRPAHVSGSNWVAVRCRSLAAEGFDRRVEAVLTSNDGLSWTLPVTVNSNEATDGGAEDCEPAIARGSGDNVMVVWSSGAGTGSPYGADYELFVASSLDAGSNWSTAALVNSDATSDGGREDRSPAIATDGAATWMIVWSSVHLGTWTTWLARSTNDGASWSVPVALSASTAVDSAGAPTMAGDGSGAWVVTWSSDDDSAGGGLLHADILHVRSSNNGVTWTAPATLSEDAGDDFDDVEPAAAGADGTLVVVWSSDDSFGGTIGGDQDILLRRSTDGGATWSATAPLNGDAGPDLGDDHAPALAASAAGTWVAAWESNETLAKTVGLDLDIFAASSADGLVWTLPSALNTTAVADETIDPALDLDEAVSLAADDGGDWIATFLHADDSNDDFGRPWSSRSLATCPAAPRMGCRVPLVSGQSKLSMLSGALGRDAMRWNWKSGQATDKADFGSPLSTTNFALCLYAADGSLLLEEDLFGSGGWKETSVGYRFADGTLERGGIRRATLRAGGDGQALLKIQADGPLTDYPRLPLASDPGSRLQLIRDDSANCWEAVFAAPTANTVVSFRASSQ